MLPPTAPAMREINQLNACAPPVHLLKRCDNHDEHDRENHHQTSLRYRPSIWNFFTMDSAFDESTFSWHLCATINTYITSYNWAINFNQIQSSNLQLHHMKSYPINRINLLLNHEVIPAPELLCAKCDEHLLPCPWHHHKHTDILPWTVGSTIVLPANEINLMKFWIVFRTRTSTFLRAYNSLCPSFYAEHIPSVAPLVRMQESAQI